MAKLSELKKVELLENVKPELMGYILEKQNVLHAKESKKKKAVSDELSLDAKPMSVAEMKKIWGYKKQEDGSLIITSYKGEETEVIIPAVIGKDTVTAIDSETFNTNAPRITEVQKKARKAITSVEFPSTIKVIPKHMFYDGYTGYYNNANAPHANLRNIILNDGIEVLSDGAFEDCNGLESIEIPNSVKVIGDSAFSGCWKLKDIKLPDGITKFTNQMFDRCGFETFEIPESVTEFGWDVFSNCWELKSVKLPRRMSEIPNGMFAMCKSLKTIDFPIGVEVINGYAFSHCPFEEIIIPDTVNTIGIGAFQNCEQLRSIVVSENVEFGDAVFEGCNLLANDKGQIIINGILFGLLDEGGSFYLSAKEAVKPLSIGDEIKKIAISRDQLPEIVYKECPSVDSIIDIDGLSVGDEVYFGRFPKSEDYLMQPLKWRVLDIVEGKALLITVDCIISQSDELRQRDIWKNSSVRTLLNKGFYSVAFTDNERAQIILTTNQNPKNEAQHVDGGPDTKDFVFLLSIDELEKYMPTEESQKAKATEYAHKQHPTNRDWGFWQLRTPGKGEWGSVAVYESGGLSATTGNHVGYSYLRPVIWIKQKEN